MDGALVGAGSLWPEKSTYWLMQKTAINGHKLKVKVCKLVIEPLHKCESIKSSVKLSLGLLSPTGYPLFQWYPQSNEILLNLSMKC
jgi:hypothetical protein